MSVMDITNICNMRCSYCCRGNINLEQRVELTVDEFIFTMKQSMETRGGFIVIQGGEPFLHKEFVLLLNEAAKLRKKESSSFLYESRLLIDKQLAGKRFAKAYRNSLFRCGQPLIFISTNGMLYSKEIHDALKNADCILEVSLDSSDEVINGLTRVGANINIIKENISKYAIDIPVSIACTITELNVNNLEELVSLACSLKCVSLKLSPVLAIGNRKELNQDFIGLYYKSLKNVIKRHEMEKHKIFLDLKTLNNFDGYQNAERSAYSYAFNIPNIFIEEHKCEAILSPKNVYIDSNLDVYGCASMKNIPSLCLGNLRNSSLREIFTDEKNLSLMRDIKKYIKPGSCTAVNIGTST